MKIAYTFHGHSRSWKECYQSFFDNIYSVAPGDIFIHTWDKVNPSFGSWWNGWQNSLDGENLIKAQKTPDFSGIYEAYKPKKFLIEEDKMPEVSKYYDINNIPTGALAHFGTKNMLESERKGFEMAMSYGNYDKIFSTRLDIKYHTKISEDEINSDSLIISDNFNGNFDVWMLGDIKTMDIKSNYFNHINRYWFDKGIFSTWYENALLNYLKDNGIHNMIRTKTDYSMIRIF